MNGMASGVMTSYPENGPVFVPAKSRSAGTVRRLSAWVLRKREWPRLRRFGNVFLAAFTIHPAQTNESYLQHLWFTIKTSLRFGIIGLLLFIHGLFPFLLTRTASSQIEKIYLLMRSRIPQRRRETLEDEYEI